MSEITPVEEPVAPLPPSVPLAAEKIPQGIRLNPEAWMKNLSGLATNAWKMKARVIDPLTKEPREEIKKEDIKKMARHVEAMFEALTALNVEVRDRTGETFDYGLPDKIVASNPQAGLTKELIVETIRPTIYWMNQIAQTGEVVIATPIESKEEKK